MTKRTPQCPICKRRCPDTPEAATFRPFCSQRCQQVDLMRWVDGKYAIVDDIDLSEIPQDTEDLDD